MKRHERAAPPKGRGPAAALLLLVAALTAGCARQPQPAQAHPSGQRLVSTAPHLTECLFAIGAGGLLAGRTESCDHPPEDVALIPITGGFGTPWLEPLLAARPTHVLETVLADPEITRRLGALGIPVVHIPCTRIDEIPAALRQLGDLTGHAAQAAPLADAITAGLAAARADAARLTCRPRVLLLFAPDTPITAGRHAFIAELLECAGGANIGRDSAIDYYHVSLEWVIAQDPDLLLCVFDTAGRDPLARFTAQLGWNALRAVRDRRVYAPRDLSAVSRPGPRVLEGLAQLQTLLADDARRFPPPPPPTP